MDSTTFGNITNLISNGGKLLPPPFDTAASIGSSLLNLFFGSSFKNPVIEAIENAINNAVQEMESYISLLDEESNLKQASTQSHAVTSWIMQQVTDPSTPDKYVEIKDVDSTKLSQIYDKMVAQTGPSSGTLYYYLNKLTNSYETYASFSAQGSIPIMGLNPPKYPATSTIMTCFSAYIMCLKIQAICQLRIITVQEDAGNTIDSLNAIQAFNSSYQTLVKELNSSGKSNVYDWLNTWSNKIYSAWKSAVEVNQFPATERHSSGANAQMYIEIKSTFYNGPTNTYNYISGPGRSGPDQNKVNALYNKTVEESNQAIQSTIQQPILNLLKTFSTLYDAWNTTPPPSSPSSAPTSVSFIDGTAPAEIANWSSSNFVSYTLVFVNDNGYGNPPMDSDSNISWSNYSPDNKTYGIAIEEGKAVTMNIPSAPAGAKQCKIYRRVTAGSWRDIPLFTCGNIKFAYSYIIHRWNGKKIWEW